MEDGSLIPLRCNTCWELLMNTEKTSSLCYRTSCSHIFCEQDAFKHFGSGDAICPVCQTDLNGNPGAVRELRLRSSTDSKKLEQLWTEMLLNPSIVLHQMQQAMDFIFFQIAQESYRQEHIRTTHEEELKNYQAKYGERYMQLKSYTEQLESETQESTRKISALTNSNEELRQSYKEKCRKSRNWEKLYKSAKTQIQALGKPVVQQVHQNPSSNIAMIQRPQFGTSRENVSGNSRENISKFRDEINPISKFRDANPISKYRDENQPISKFRDDNPHISKFREENHQHHSKYRDENQHSSKYRDENERSLSPPATCKSRQSSRSKDAAKEPFRRPFAAINRTNLQGPGKEDPFAGRRGGIQRRIMRPKTPMPQKPKFQLVTKRPIFKFQ